MKQFEEYKVCKSLLNAISVKYKIISIISSGAYSIVAKGICRNTGVGVALKIMIKQVENDYDSVRVLREI